MSGFLPSPQRNGQESLVLYISAGSRGDLEHLLDWALKIWEVTGG